MNRLPLILAITLAASIAACGGKKKPVKQPDPVPTQTAEPAPPPPPKCEKLDEKCEAIGGKKARIAGIGLTVEPVVGWIYAQAEKATVAQTGEDSACFGLAGFEVDAKDTKKNDATRQTTFETIATELNITLGKAKVPWKTTGDKLEVGQLKLTLWEVKDVTRKEKKGDLLVIASTPGDGKSLLGVAFVPKDDDQSGQKIMTSIQTLAPGEAP